MREMVPVHEWTTSQFVTGFLLAAFILFALVALSEAIRRYRNDYPLRGGISRGEAKAEWRKFTRLRRQSIRRRRRRNRARRLNKRTQP